MRILMLSIACLLLLALKCNKGDDKPNGNNNSNQKETLPPATQTGEGTFGCKVNGEVWVPKTPPLTPSVHADYFEDEFFISANKKLKNEGFKSSFHLDIDSEFNGENQYKLSSKKTKIYGRYGDAENNCDYLTDSMNTGILTITHFDSAKRIVAGRFHFTAVIKQGKCEKDTIRVTEGRFDIQD